MPCHVMASRAMPGHIFASHAIFLRVMNVQWAFALCRRLRAMLSCRPFSVEAFCDVGLRAMLSRRPFSEEVFGSLRSGPESNFVLEAFLSGGGLRAMDPQLESREVVVQLFAHEISHAFVHTVSLAYCIL